MDFRSPGPTNAIPDPQETRDTITVQDIGKEGIDTLDVLEGLVRPLRLMEDHGMSGIADQHGPTLDVCGERLLIADLEETDSGSATVYDDLINIALKRPRPLDLPEDPL